MFFIFGISSKEKDIDFSQTIICKSCGSHGRLEAFMTYTYFSLFFIPIIKWNRKHYIRSTCCNTLYIIDRKLGRDIEKGYIREINEEDLQFVNEGYNNLRYCDNCNYPIERDFEYCPKCGTKV